jgi:acyl-coenzyme A thioesterase PaaI-like protein
MVSSNPETTPFQDLAAGLRRLHRQVIGHEFSDTQATELLAEIEALSARIDGPVRPRYYEYDHSEEGNRNHNAFLDYSPVSGRAHPGALPLHIEHLVAPDGTKSVEGRIRVDHLHEGPPRGLHGGYVAALFDELLGHALYGHRLQAVTAHLTIRYRTLTPIDEDLVFRGHIEHKRGRQWVGYATCHAGETLTAEAEGLFILVDLRALAAGASATPDTPPASGDDTQDGPRPAEP